MTLIPVLHVRTKERRIPKSRFVNITENWARSVGLELRKSENNYKIGPQNAFYDRLL